MPSPRKIMFGVLLTLTTTISSSALSIPEKQIPEQKTSMLEYFDRGRAMPRKVRDGAHIFVYQSPVPTRPKGHILILPGYGENHRVYVEFVYDLGQRGYQTTIIDHRSMGLSERTTANPQVAHIDDFEQYTEDVSDVLSQLPPPQNPYLMVAHSTGGLIGLNTIKKHPKRFAGAFLTAPLIGMQTGGFPYWVARPLVWFLNFFGYGKEFVIGRENTTPEKHFVFGTDYITHSEIRFDFMKSQYIAHPKILVAGPSNGWMEAAFQATQNVRSHDFNIDIPLIFLQAEHEHYVENIAMEEFCTKARDCQLQRYKNAYHSLLLEQDSIRQPVMNSLNNFLDRFAGGAQTK